MPPCSTKMDTRAVSKPGLEIVCQLGTQRRGVDRQKGVRRIAGGLGAFTALDDVFDSVLVEVEFVGQPHSVSWSGLHRSTQTSASSSPR